MDVPWHDGPGRGGKAIEKALVRPIATPSPEPATTRYVRARHGTGSSERLVNKPLLSLLSSPRPLPH